MITFLIVYKHNVSNSFNNMTYMCDGAPCLSEIKMRIMDKHKWKEGLGFLQKEMISLSGQLGYFSDILEVMCL